MLAKLVATVAALAFACGPGRIEGDTANQNPDSDGGNPSAEDAGRDDDKPCTVNSDCDDGNPCTDDVCSSSGSCEWAANSDPCDDGDDCTSGDSCQDGDCRGAEACCDDEVNNDGDAHTDCDDADCSPLPICEGACPALEPVEDSPLPVESTDNAIESTTINGFTDDYVYNAASTLKIGTRQEWGGTIVFFGMGTGSPGMNGTNAIDANDTGREVQVAFYDPDRRMQDCAWNASCASAATNCPASITYLGWNPVQGGNRCNNGSGVEAVDLADGAINITTDPLFWNPNWDRADCVDEACGNPSLNTRRSDVRVIQRVRFVRSHVVELDYTVINLEALDHRATAHELPTVYTANGEGGPDLWRLFNSAGTEIAIDTPGNDGFYYENFTSPGGWATMQNDDLDYGVGLYTENRLTGFQGWQNRGLPFNNFRPGFSFAIPPYGQIRARSYLILGSLATVGAEAQWLDAHLPPFGVLDAPVADAEVSGTVALHGWALDNKGVAAIELVIDGGAPIPLTYGASRPDVCAVWPGYAGCSDVGYSGSFDAGALAPAECGHVLEINAIDGDGNQRIIARRRVYVAE
jgi:hypothetical protein